MNKLDTYILDTVKSRSILWEAGELQLYIMKFTKSNMQQVRDSMLHLIIHGKLKREGKYVTIGDGYYLGSWA